jgi:hypothetical protein
MGVWRVWPRFPALLAACIAATARGEVPGSPKALPDSDAVRDAAGTGQRFESIHAPGITDVRAGLNSFAVADLDRDGRLDLVTVRTPPLARGAHAGGAARTGDVERVANPKDRLAFLLNGGGWVFREHPVRVDGSVLADGTFGDRGQVPVLADFNADGFLDLFLTRHSPATAGRVRPGVALAGNTLLLSRGAFDAFDTAPDARGAANALAYNRQPSPGDVDGDGFLDIAVGADNIGNAMGGVPHSRLYVYRPSGQRFEDIGGGPLVPDFGGFHHDSTRDKAGPDINLRDLDQDGDLDLVQSYHADVREPLLPYSPGEYRQGVFLWKNLLSETGTLRFEKVTGNGLAAEARMVYDRQAQAYRHENDARAPGLPYLFFADVDNDGLEDVLAVGPSHLHWPRPEYVGGRFWRNLGGLRFEERTDAQGLSPLNYTYRQWFEFFAQPLPESVRYFDAGSRRMLHQPGLPLPNPLDNRPYYACAVFGDFDNDGFVDLVVLDRTERRGFESRAVLFLNRGDGTFALEKTEASGLDSAGIAGQAADFDSDGLLDLLFAADPDNTGTATDVRRYESRVYRNMGIGGARDNHWLRVRLGGITDAAAIGARIEVRSDGRLIGLRTIHADHVYNAGSPLEAHFGLGRASRVDVVVTPLRGRSVTLRDVAADRLVEVDVAAGSVRDIALR